MWICVHESRASKQHPHKTNWIKYPSLFDKITKPALLEFLGRNYPYTNKKSGPRVFSSRRLLLPHLKIKLSLSVSRLPEMENLMSFNFPALSRKSRCLCLPTTFKVFTISVFLSETSHHYPGFNYQSCFVTIHWISWLNPQNLHL